MPALKYKVEDLIRLKDVPTWLSSHLSVHIAISSVYNWIHIGRNSYFGNRVKLKTIKRRSVHYTTPEWIMLFLREVR